MLKAQRVAVLVDSENIDIAVLDIQKKTKSGRGAAFYPEWRAILGAIVGERALVRAIYFKERGRPLSKKFQSFWIEEIGGEIRQPWKSADSSIVVEAISLSQHVDTIVLFSGDKDFLPLIGYLKAHGCRIEVAAFAQSTARTLRAVADYFHKLSPEHVLSVRRSSQKK